MVVPAPGSHWQLLFGCLTKGDFGHLGMAQKTGTKMEPWPA